MKNNIKNSILAVLSFVAGFGVAILLLAVSLSVGKIATINGDALSIGEFADYIEIRKNALLLDYVEDSIRISALEELGITVNKSEIDKRFNSIAVEKGGYDAFEEELEMAGTSVAQYKLNIHKMLLDEKAGKYFTDKQVITEAEIDTELERRDNEGESLVTMDAKSVMLKDGEDETLDTKGINGDRITLHNNVSIEQFFDEVPKAGDRKVITNGNNKELIIVENVYEGNDNSNIRGYIREILKITKAQSGYKKYLEDKVDNAKIMIK